MLPEKPQRMQTGSRVSWPLGTLFWSPVQEGMMGALRASKAELLVSSFTKDLPLPVQLVGSLQAPGA